MKFFPSLIGFVLPFVVFSQIQKAPERKEGEGPWDQLIIRGVILVDGTGAPPVGPRCKKIIGRRKKNGRR